MTTTARRDFITRTGGALAAATAAAILDVPHVIAQPKVQWRLSTTYPPVLDQLHGAAQRLATVVEEMSGGRFRIEVFPGGQIMQPFECFDASFEGHHPGVHGRSDVLVSRKSRPSNGSAPSRSA